MPRRAFSVKSENPGCWKCGTVLEVQYREKSGDKRLHCPKCGAETEWFGSLAAAQKAATDIGKYFESVRNGGAK